jgi:hypothetical protein
MSGLSITIGDKTFDSKSKALVFYKDILNSYEVGDCLSEDDCKNISNLVYMGLSSEEVKAYEEETGDYIKSVVIDTHPEFRNTKCFFLIGGTEEKQLFSCLLAINGAVSDDKRFLKACRHTISGRLREFKKQQFKNRPVKCAITNEIVEWEDCQIDHKAPLTFSVIVKSFIVANKIDIRKVEYVSELTKEHFADQELADKFDAFHKEMAVLRVLVTKQNRKLSGGARIKPTKKDGTLS